MKFSAVQGRKANVRRIDQHFPPGEIPTLFRKIRSNGAEPEFISIALADWAEQHGIELEFIKPGTPTQNSYDERFNRTYRDEILNMYVFRNLTEVREPTQFWMTAYNDDRPRDPLEDLTPWEYLAKHQQAENSNLLCN